MIEKKVGRKSVLTSSAHTRIIEAVRKGNYVQTACAFAGVSVAAFMNWHSNVLPKALEKVESGSPLSLHEKDVLKLFRDIEKAEAEFEMDMLGLIVDDSEREVNHAKWLLERRIPSRWGGKNVVNVEHSGKVDSENVVSVEIGEHITNALQSLEKFNSLLPENGSNVTNDDPSTVE